MAGVALLAVAAFAIRMLYYRAGSSSGLEPGLLDFMLATIGFFASSAGAMGLLLGAHIFDQVRVSERWAHRDVSALTPAVPEQSWSIAGVGRSATEARRLPKSTDSSHCHLASSHAPMTFARAERQFHPDATIAVSCAPDVALLDR